MKRLILTVAAIAALGVGLAACETATPYQPAPAGQRTGAYGFSDYRIDDSHWKVTFSGNSMTSRETVEKYLLYRAAELTRQQGFDWFATNDRRTEKNTSYYADPDPFYRTGFWASYGWGWHPYWRYGGRWGWRSWDPWFGDPFWTSTVDIREVESYEASAEINMGKDPPPPGGRVFNAQQVLTNLGSSVQRPK
jgi:hypothetical protein